MTVPTRPGPGLEFEGICVGRRVRVVHIDSVLAARLELPRKPAAGDPLTGPDSKR